MSGKKSAPFYLYIKARGATALKGIGKDFMQRVKEMIYGLYTVGTEFGGGVVAAAIKSRLDCP